ncbi:MAG TPA: 3'-5' exonuclease [Candidatus Limnocylindria bacterium]|nr:3'-5' exonuclease [Candidatus Limnocylindria bacterium]
MSPVAGHLLCLASSSLGLAWSSDVNPVPPLDLIVVDLEATCWKDGNLRERQEIIEIGAVRLSADTRQLGDSFSLLVRPTLEPVLTDFCKQLTGIRQEEVDSAESFPVVFERFLAWTGSGPYRLASWGGYDLKQLNLECTRHQTPPPGWFADHVNVKQAFARWKRIQPCGMASALEFCQLPLDGRHHRGLDDAMNIAKMAALIPEPFLVRSRI